MLVIYAELIFSDIDQKMLFDAVSSQKSLNPRRMHILESPQDVEQVAFVLRPTPSTLDARSCEVTEPDVFKVPCALDEAPATRLDKTRSLKLSAELPARF